MPHEAACKPHNSRPCVPSCTFINKLSCTVQEAGTSGTDSQTSAHARLAQSPTTQAFILQSCLRLLHSCEPCAAQHAVVIGEAPRPQHHLVPCIKQQKSLKVLPSKGLCLLCFSSPPPPPSLLDSAPRSSAPLSLSVMTLDGACCLNPEPSKYSALESASIKTCQTVVPYLHPLLHLHCRKE